tara:strand:- start:274 stop:1572 length:1299 start_codon:yes stop_codon:yes gene_type:complete
MIGKKIHDLCKILWPINRSITGNGVRKTLDILKKKCSEMKIYEVASGTKVFDWTIPNEWNVKEAKILGPGGKKILDFYDNNLHLVGYSTPINKKMSLKELNKHLFSLKEKPKAIPYVTSYYKKNWGFCLSHNNRKKLKSGKYKVLINSELKKGSLTYGEIFLPGKSKKEIFLSTYICHPSLANNELSGPTVSIFIANWIKSLKDRKFSYRIIFIPETIGSITYLSKNLKKMKRNMYAGFNITCVGDERMYSYLPSRNGDTIADHTAKHILKWTDKNYKKYTWLDRGSDERQYCSPGIDLPVATIMRSKGGEYPEYHTSLDNLKNVVTPKGLNGSFNLIKKIIESFEFNCYPKNLHLCEPQLSKRNLYPSTSNWSKKENYTYELRLMKDLISFSDGKTSLLNIAENCKVPIWDFYSIIRKLEKNKIIKILFKI